MPKKNKINLQKKLQTKTFAFRERLAQKTAQDYGLNYLNLTKKTIPQDVLHILTKEDIERSQAVVIDKTKHEIDLAIVRPNYSETLKTANRLKKLYPQLELKTCLISENSLRHILAIYKEKIKITKTEKKSIAINNKSLTDLKELINDKNKLVKLPASDVLEKIIAAAVSVNSSDIHWEADTDKTLIRFRIDGVLEDIACMPLPVYQLIKARIKILSNLKLNITNIPQDGSFTIKAEKYSLNFRVSALPGANAENVVLRILSSDIGDLLKISNLGFTQEETKRVKESLDLATGAILLTGPTGSGKTTSLYAFLNYKTNPGVKIITLEDPIEYKIPKLSQIEIETDEGLSFAEGLRGILRQDPDIIMVGEVRDPDTANTLIQAANTGHLVFSTLHANSAIDIIQRLSDLGVNSKKIANTIKLLINQRLLRKLCSHCKVAYKIKPEILQTISSIMGQKMPSKTNTFKATGCEKCNGDGYIGRLSVFEILQVNSEISEMILAGDNPQDIQNQAKKNQGLNTVLEAAYLKLFAGLTTLEEIDRIF